MLSAAIVILSLAAVLFGVYQNGTWRQRARSAERQNRTDRKAHSVQNRVAVDSAYRERVRRRFDVS